jgi:hypothetical protein
MMKLWESKASNRAGAETMLSNAVEESRAVMTFTEIRFVILAAT